MQLARSVAQQEIMGEGGLAEIDGTWNVIIASPAGAQKATMTVRSAGETFEGDFTGDDGTVEIADGKVDGDTISWSMQIAKPLPMKLTSKLTLTDGAFSGAVTAGAFGSFPMSGTRA